MSKMTYEKAIQIKSDYLDKIKDYIPDALVQGLFSEFVEYAGLDNRTPVPCSCDTKYWVQLIDKLKAAVNEAIAEHEVVSEPIAEEVVEEPIVKSAGRPKKVV